MRIITVLGEVEPERLGPTHMHEHLVIRLANPLDEGSASPDEVQGAVEDVRRFARAGGRCLVDLTNRGMARDVRALAEISGQTGVGIVCATGFYQQHYYPSWVAEWPVERLADLLTEEILDGIEGTNIRAGIIGEIGSSFGKIMPLEEKVFKAAARAQRQTGSAISTHTSYGTMLLEQIDLLDHESVPLDRVVIGHAELNNDLAIHLEALRRGVVLEYDTVGKERWRLPNGGMYELADDLRETLILRVLDAGHEDQLVLGSDIMGKRRTDEAALNPATLGRYGLGYILGGFIPRLLAKGVSHSAIEKFLVCNPRRLLSF
jgi:predicted metal-dependent phosphotriesterase family hydrolase